MNSLLERAPALGLIAIFSFSLPAIALLLVRKRTEAYNWLLVCFLYSFLTDVSALTLMYFWMNANYAVNQYSLVSSIFLFTFFYHAIPGKNSKWAFAMPAIFISLFVGFTFFRYGLDGHSSYTMALQSIAIITYSVTYYYRTMKILPVERMSGHPMFWIISGFFLSYAGKFFVYAISRYLLDWYNDNLKLLWDVHNSLSIVGNLMALAGVCIYLSKKKDTAPISS